MVTLFAWLALGLNIYGVGCAGLAAWRDWTAYSGRDYFPRLTASRAGSLSTNHADGER